MRKKILAKNGILRFKKTDQIVCGYKAGPPFVRQRAELEGLPVGRGPLLRTVINNLSLSLGLKVIYGATKLKTKSTLLRKSKVLYLIFRSTSHSIKKDHIAKSKSPKKSRIGFF